MTVNWDDDKELARRAASISPFGVDEALDALEAGGERRELMLQLIRGNEETERVRKKIREAQRGLRRASAGYFW